MAEDAKTRIAQIHKQVEDLQQKLQSNDSITEVIRTARNMRASVKAFEIFLVESHLRQCLPSKEGKARGANEKQVSELLSLLVDSE